MGIDSSTNTDVDATPLADIDPLEAVKEADEDRVHDAIAATTLPPRVRDLIADYEELVGFRDRVLWEWIHVSIQHIRLSCVPAVHNDTVVTAKMLGMLYLCTLDDIADQIGDARVLAAAAHIHSPHMDATALDQLVDDQAAANQIDLLQRTWSTLEDVVADAPRTDEFWPLLPFDMDAVLMSMKYSRVVNDHPAALNLVEGLGYGGHNFGYYMLADIDLMYSPEFDRRDLSVLRRILWPVQHLHRLVNWAVTWEREIAEGDVSAGVFAAALNEELVTPAELQCVQMEDHDPDAVRTQIAAANLDQQLLKRWEATYLDTLDTALTADTSSVDLIAYMVGVLRVCQSCFVMGADK